LRTGEHRFSTSSKEPEEATGERHGRFPQFSNE
jgi:hypothetical protein